MRVIRNEDTFCDFDLLLDDPDLLDALLMEDAGNPDTEDEERGK